MFYARNNIFGPNCTVFVSNLSKTVAEATLFKTFNQVGVISSARVVRDPNTGASLGQAYLNFVDPVDAERALKTMNGQLIDGQKIRIRRKKKETNLFIKDIPAEITKQDLEKAFEKYGKIASCRIMNDKEGNPMGYGYLRFTDQTGADTAIDAALSDDGIVLKDKKISVDYYQTWKERSHEMKMNEHFFKCIHLKGYPTDWKKEDIEKLFPEDNKPESIDIPTATNAEEEGGSKSYCFATFAEHDNAAKALSMNGQKIDDTHNLVVTRLMSNFERQQTQRKKYIEQKRENHRLHRGRNLYVKNFPLDWDKEQLKDLFSKYGTVSSTKVMKNSKEASRGFGFVCFEDKSCAQVALDALNNVPIEGKPLFVNHAELKEARRQRLWGNQQAGTPRTRGGYQRGGWNAGGGGAPWSPRGQYQGGGYRGRGRGRGRGGRGRRGRPRGRPAYFSQPGDWVPMNIAAPYVFGQ